jgi:hypothetical protein
VAAALVLAAAACTVLLPDRSANPPSGTPRATTADGHGGHAHGGGSVLGDGTRATVAGYSLANAHLDPAARRISFEVRDAAGVVRDLARVHAKKLHMYVLSADLLDFRHVHPRMDAAGSWSVRTPRMPAGRVHVVAELVPSAGTQGRAVMLGTDLTADGTTPDRPLPRARTVVDVDGYTVYLDANFLAGRGTQATVTVRDRAGRRVALQPYLESWAHAALLRSGTLSAAHLHPIEEWRPGGASPGELTFPVRPDGRGAHRLVVEFATGTGVHVAAFTVRAT